ncbi:MAG TPA: hypothetical protein VIH49_06875 [Solirubrobacteraceae bacterium]
MARRGRRVARILIVGGGCRGRRFAERMVEQGHAVRATTRGEAGRAAIEATGAECWIGTPDRLATLRGALENVTVACWMLACAYGSDEQIVALHCSRLEFFLSQAIDTTARGLIYDAWAVAGGAADAGGVEADGADARRPTREMLAEGARIFRSLTELNAIPAVVLEGSGERLGERPGEGEGLGERAGSGEERREANQGPHSEDAAWVAAACDAVTALLGGDR